MDLPKLIQELYAEKKRLEQVIASLEELHKSTDAAPGAAAVDGHAKRRGRKSMGEEERGLVSERMRRYWASRRKQQRSKTPL